MREDWKHLPQTSQEGLSLTWGGQCPPPGAMQHARPGSHRFIDQLSRVVLTDWPSVVTSVTFQCEWERICPCLTGDLLNTRGLLDARGLRVTPCPLPLPVPKEVSWPPAPGGRACSPPGAMLPYSHVNLSSRLLNVESPSLVARTPPIHCHRTQGDLRPSC